MVPENVTLDKLLQIFVKRSASHVEEVIPSASHTRIPGISFKLMRIRLAFHNLDYKPAIPRTF
jgi:hypothetical protein